MTNDNGKIDTSDIPEAGEEFFEKATLIQPRTIYDHRRYNHREAFALMWYACPCGHRERIWNSRDGVTPFGGVDCPSCGNKVAQEQGFPGLQHIWWQQDACTPDHQLRDGQRFFRDGTPDEAVAIINRRIAAIESREPPPGVPPLGPIPEDVKARLLSDALNCTGEWQKGWPVVDRYSANPGK